MDTKKIGIWTGGFIGLFVVLVVLVYFLYPILKPDKVKSVNEQEHLKVKMASFNQTKHNSLAADSLHQRPANRRIKIDSLTEKNKYKLQLIDSLRQALKSTKDSVEELSAYKQRHAVSAKEASKSLLSLDKGSLGPIVNLLNEDQLIGLYKNADDRQRQKLLRSLDPKKAASILKQVLK